jgi:uncharacterized protein YcfL
MKKYLIAAVIMFSLIGCFHQTINSNDIHRAQTFYLEKGLQVVQIKAVFGGTETVTCSDDKESQI